jgi:hypothetical protein
MFSESTDPSVVVHRHRQDVQRGHVHRRLRRRRSRCVLEHRLRRGSRLHVHLQRVERLSKLGLRAGIQGVQVQLQLRKYVLQHADVRSSVVPRAV